jgi:hypothetical protein
LEGPGAGEGHAYRRSQRSGGKYRTILLTMHNGIKERRWESDEMTVAVNEAAADSIMHSQLELPRSYRKIYE